MAIRIGIGGLKIGSGGSSWSSYWTTGYLTGLAVATTSDTTQTITATIVGTGVDGVSWEYSNDGCATWHVKGTSAIGSYNATGLTAGLMYIWRARLYKGSQFGSYALFDFHYTWCAEYLAIHNSFTTKPSSSLAQSYNDFIIGRIASGVWAKLDKFLYFGTHVNSDGEALKNWKNPGTLDATLESVIPPTFTADKGFTGVPANSTYINTKFNPVRDGVNYTLDDAGMGCYILNNKAAAAETTIGSSIWPDFIELDSKIDNSGNILEVAINCRAAGMGASIVNDDSAGFYHLRRPSDSLSDAWKNNTDNNSVSASNGMPDAEVFALARNFHLAPDRFSSDQLACLWFSSSLTDAEVADLRSGVINLVQCIGSGKYFCMGTILEHTVAEDELTIMEPTIIYEGNAKILTGNVFKMWYTQGWAHPAICYAESYTGLPKTWQKYSGNPVIPVSSCRSFVIKVAGVYYHYVLNGVSSALDLYTSTDGVNYSLDTANILTKGGVGEWDSTSIDNMAIIIEAGTWYMFYDGIKTGVNSYKIGLATSADGKTWTKYGSNPVINETTERGAPFVKKVGTSFYLWCLGVKAGGVYLPTDLTERYKSTDLLSWAKDTYDFVYERATVDEGTGTGVGQVADPYLIEVENKIYLFYSASVDGSVNTGELHVKLAVVNMPFTDLVKTQEGRA